MLTKFNPRHIKGRIGENLAVFLLIFKGYRVVDVNHKGHFAEVDILALKGTGKQRLLLLVEVKTRKTRAAAELAIHPAQRERLLRQAQALQRKFKTDEVRLDAILVFPHWPFLQHLQRAWE